MKIKFSGHTRIVVLTHRRAYKIARFRPFRLLFRMMLFPFQTKEKRSRFYERYGRFPIGLWNYTIIGFIANRNEFQYSRQNRDSRVAPVVGRKMGYFIISQVAGRPVPPRKLYRSGFLACVPMALRVVLLHGMQNQFALVNGKVRLVDYGESGTRTFLEVTRYRK